MAADKTMLKKNKPNKRLYTRTYVYCKQKQKQKEREREREEMVRSTTYKVKNLKASYILP